MLIFILEYCIIIYSKVVLDGGTDVKPRILIISETFVEFVQRMETLPYPGAPVTGVSYDYIPGGEGSEMAVTAAALGADPILCSRIGADSNGQRVRTIFREMGIDTRFMFMDRRAATGLISILTDGAKVLSVTYPGANALLSVTDAEDAFTALPDGALISLRAPERVVIAASEYAARKHIPLLVDGGPTQPDFAVSKLFPVEIFCLDETELESMTGIAPKATESCLRAAIRLSSIVRAKYYVVKMGSRGVFLYDGKYYNIVIAHSVPVEDASGVGSVFDTSLLTEYMRSGDIQRAAAYANAASALAVSKPGRLDAIPTEEELGEFIDRKGIKL